MSWKFVDEGRNVIEVMLFYPTHEQDLGFQKGKWTKGTKYVRHLRIDAKKVNSCLWRSICVNDISSRPKEPIFFLFSNLPADKFMPFSIR